MKFTFKQRVKVIKGFFKGTEGLVYSHIPSWKYNGWFSSHTYPEQYYVAIGETWKEGPRMERFLPEELEAL